jgi:hypothetical protein
VTVLAPARAGRGSRSEAGPQIRQYGGNGDNRNDLAPVEGKKKNVRVHHLTIAVSSRFRYVS